MKKIMTNPSDIVKNSLITAFTLVAAFAWRDVFTKMIEIFVPQRQEIYYQFLIAIVTTIIVVVAIIIVLKTGEEAEIVIKSLKKKNFR